MVMQTDELDALIKEFGHDNLIKEIRLREKSSKSSIWVTPIRSGPPARLIDEIFGLIDAFDYFKDKRPNETNGQLVAQIISQANKYSNWKLKPVIYKKELDGSEPFYDHIQWIAEGKVSEKTLLNKILEYKSRVKSMQKRFPLERLGVDEIAKKNSE